VTLTSWLGYDCDELFEVKRFGRLGSVLLSVIDEGVFRRECSGEFGAVGVFRECVQEDATCWRGPFSFASPEDYWVADFLAWGIDDEVAFVPALIFDDAINASVLDAFVAEFEDDFIVLILRVLNQFKLAVRAIAFVSRAGGGNTYDAKKEEGLNHLFHCFTKIVNGRVLTLPFHINWA
jgi:hypothetical protein